jgi:mono/diheme cytochrome c family protein
MCWNLTSMGGVNLQEVSMMRILSLKLALILAATLTLAAPTFGGGWAVVTLDELPTQVVANKPTKIGFMVRGHGHTPLAGVQTSVVFFREGGARLLFDAKPQGATGHYVAEIELPEAGEWRWHIMTWMEHVMPDLTVLASAPVSAQSVDLSNRLAQLPLIGGLFSQARQRAELARQTALGQDLFLAKGCVTCHTHEAVSGKVSFSTNVGPNLTHRPLDPNYLRIWLKDPSAVKSGTEMPNLSLVQTEIEALTAFLTQK